MALLRFLNPSRLFARLDIKLYAALTTVFVLLTVPVTAFILVFNYQANKTLIANHSEQFMYRSINDSYNNTTKLFNPLLAVARTGVDLMRNEPNFFRKSTSDDFLHEIVDSNEAIHSAYAVFADGATREVARAVEGMKVHAHSVPGDAQFITRVRDRRSTPGVQNGAASRAKAARDAPDRFAFHGPWETVIEQVSLRGEPTSSILDTYSKTFELNSVNISDPHILPVSGVPGITVSAPALSRDGRNEIGMVGIDLTLTTLARLLSQSRATPDSFILMIDRQGRVVIPTDDLKDEGSEGQAPVLKRVEDLKNAVILAAWTERLRLNEDRFNFRVGAAQTEYQCIFFPFDDTFKKPWELVMITPVDNFVGEINRTNRNIVTFGIAAFLIQVTLIYLLSRSLSSPLERLVRFIDQIRRFDFDEPQHKAHSVIAEIGYLFKATGLLARALESFALYVPRGLVQKLLQSDIGTKRVVESRYLTMFFTDLEGFTALSESEPQQLLLTRISDYFSVITGAVGQEFGTVDKFIGDAVMAFWGAPNPLEAHCYHACVAAVKTQRRMRQLNDGWATRNLPPLNVRIGVHCDSVLVGNVGSVERLSYTVMGDGVNLASRLEGLNKEFGTLTCVSHQVFREAGERLCLRPIDTISVKGRKGEVLVYDLLGILDGDEEVRASAEELALSALTREAYGYYSRGDHVNAVQAYLRILERFPDDKVAKRMLAKAGAV